MYVVGQTYPVVEVPGPHSRKTTTQLKHRLQTIAFKLCSKSEDGRIRIGKVMKYFNDQNEMQMRQRLKVSRQLQSVGDFIGRMPQSKSDSKY
jgi:transcription initiation factor TFIID subunit 1